MTKKEFINRYLLVEAGIFILMLTLDLVSKAVVASHMSVGQSIVVIPHLFHFTFVKNTGAAFGMLANQQWFFILITFLAVGVFGFVLFKFRKGSKLFRIALVLILAGALGNLIDRLFLGYVRDFIEFAFMNFAIFNFADTQLVIGVILFAVYLIFIYKEDPKKKKKDGETTAADSASESAPDAKDDGAL